MKKITNKVLAAILTLVLVVSSIVVSTKETQAMYDDNKWDLSEYEPDGYIITYPANITDDEAIQLFLNNYNIAKKSFEAVYAEENACAAEYMSKFESEVIVKDKDYFVGYMKNIGMPTATAPSYIYMWYFENYEYNYYYDVTNAGKPREQVKAEDAAKEMESINAEIDKYLPGYLEDEKDPSIETDVNTKVSNIKTKPLIKAETVTNTSFTVTWKHEYMYALRSSEYDKYIYFELQIATNKNFNNAKTYTVSILDLETPSKNHFKYTFKNLDNGKTYYYRIRNKYDFPKYWEEEILSDYADEYGCTGSGKIKPDGPTYSKYASDSVLVDADPDVKISLDKKGNNVFSYGQEKVTVKKAKVKKAVKASKKAKKIKISLKKVKGAVGYQVVIYKSKTMAKKNKLKRAVVKKFTKKRVFTITNKKLKGKDKLWVKARAYVVIGKKKHYGKWSAIKKVKIKR